MGALATFTPDARTASEWAESNGFSFRLTEVGNVTHATFSSGDPRRWAYFGKGSPTRAVHEAMTYAVRDRGFDGEFVEHCGTVICPFCTAQSFPTDGERVMP